MGLRGPRVSIIGESVLVEGIVVGLEDIPHITMQHLLAYGNDTLSQLTEFNPDIIIYPLGDPDLEKYITRFRMKQTVRLIALENDSDRVSITDCQVHHALSLEAFLELIAASSQEFSEPVESGSLLV